ncbi:MAG: hypothetical protein SynsKO_15980 [Synoicihabitans sp.]
MTSCFVILSPNPGVTQSLQEIVRGRWKHIIVVSEPGEIDQLIETGARVGGAALHLDLVAKRGLSVIEKVRTHMGTGPLVIYSANPFRETDEDALRLGASLIQTLPVRAEVLTSHLNIFERKTTEREPSNPPFASSTSAPSTSPAATSRSTLEILRDCSAILACALDTDEMLSRFSGVLRDMVGISKVAVFLRSSPANMEEHPTASHFPLAFVRGIAPSIAKCLKLSPSEGTPAWLARNRKVLEKSSLDVSEEVHSELELLGASTAFPLVNRGNLFGVLFLGDRVAGKPLKDNELTLIYHLAEELSLALENAALHRESKNRAELMRQMLERAEAGTVLVDSSLQVMQCNPAACRFIGLEPNSDIAFASLPQWLQSRLFEQVKSPEDTGEQFMKVSGRLLRVVCCSVPSVGHSKSTGAMATLEDHTEIRRARDLALQEQRFKITGTIAERLTHEILNSVTQLSTYEQLFPDRISEPDFQNDLQTSLRAHTSRVTRLVTQLSYLTGTKAAVPSSNGIKEMLDEAAQRARNFIDAPNTEVSVQGPDLFIGCDRGAFICGMEEVLLNALQANLSDPSVTVKISKSSGSLQLKFSDHGPGFTEESALRATEAFFTTRNVGLGLGLSVASAIIERLGGTLQISPQAEEAKPNVIIHLPL